MNRRFARNLLAYLVPTFALGYGWHLSLFADAYRELSIYRSDVLVPFGFLAMLLQGVVVALTYPRLIAEPERLSGGLRYAAGAALLAWTFTTLAVAAKHPMTSVPRFLALETAFTAAQFILVGPVLALSSRPRARPVPTPEG